MSGTHSILPPSGAGAWRYCAMWVTMNQLYPSPETPESMEGTAGHWVWEEMLEGRMVVEGQIAPNGVIITDEMIDGAELVCEVVRQRLPKERYGKPHVESAVHIARVHSQCWGTPDIWAYDMNPFVLEVIDYKFGHRYVEEYENDQGVCYVAGAIDEIARRLGDKYSGIEQMLQVNFTVVQPRCFYKGAPVRTWSFNASDIRGQINILNAAADASLASNPTATTNPACGDCPGRHMCPALQRAAYADAETAVKSAPVQLNPEAASLELKMLERSLERLQSRVEGMREQVAYYVKQGHRVPWHKAEQNYGRPQWTFPIDEVIAMGEMFGADLRKPGVLTPTQAKKLHIDESVIKAYSVTPLGQVKLVPDNPADARRVFGFTS